MFNHSVTGARCGGASDARRTSRRERGPGGGLCSRGFGPERDHHAAKCEYEPTQRPRPPPSLTTCDVASASSRSSTAGSSTPQQGHSLSRLLTTTLSLRATSPSGKRCIPNLWSSASRSSPPADLGGAEPSRSRATLHSACGPGSYKRGSEVPNVRAHSVDSSRRSLHAPSTRRRA